MRRDHFTPRSGVLLFLLPAFVPLALPFAFAGCAARNEITIDGAAAFRPTARDSVLVWQPIATGEPARIHLKNGVFWDVRVVAGDDSVLIVEGRSNRDLLHAGSNDTIPREQIVSVEQRGAIVAPSFPFGFAVGSIAGLAVFIAAVSAADGGRYRW